MRGLVALTLAAALSACSHPKQLFVDHAWVRLAAVPSNPAAAYFTVHGGPQPATLIDVSTDVAIKAEMHEGGATMTPTPRIPIPANTKVVFAPGGRHVMLFHMNPGIKPGGTITLTFSFASGERILVGADVIGAGDPAPKE